MGKAGKWIRNLLVGKGTEVAIVGEGPKGLRYVQARRALRALRGLVKLQALVKGYLVRKQMNYVLRSVHDVMSIQVRTRMQMVQMADQPIKISYKQTSAPDAQIPKHRVCLENRVDHGTREIMAPTNSKHFWIWHENKPFIRRLANCPDQVTSNSRFLPKYMSNTKSSKTKTRSHRESKQRPFPATDQKRGRSPSMDSKMAKTAPLVNQDLPVRQIH
ncbi:uncharacterized protein [Primulina eburnea]|uniref:uncharacterized protein n=1 Tax=Primulina eburnea TaxID=1245227 RepID=UPI003C6C9BD4